MNLGTGFNRRHPRSVILIRVLVTAWLLGLTGFLLANGYWAWALPDARGRGSKHRAGLSRLPDDNALDPTHCGCAPEMPRTAICRDLNGRASLE